MGPITNVVLFDKEAEGVASVRYGNAEAAKACIDVRYVSSSLFVLQFYARTKAS